MYRWGLLFIITLLLIVLPPRSYASSPLPFSRNLAQQNNNSPAPSPSYGDKLASSGLNETCKMESRSCHLKNITACLPHPESGPQDLFLFVQNNGEGPLEVKIRIPAANNTVREIHLPSHRLEKINISSYAGSSSSIALNAGDGDCVIHMEAPAPQDYHHQMFPSPDTYVTPINGAYVVILLIIIVGGSLAFFKLRNRGRHLDGVPYHELEMGNSTALSSLNVEDEEEGWDQYWDDEWDEEKTGKSSGINHENGENGKSVNGLTTKSPDSKK